MKRVFFIGEGANLARALSDEFRERSGFEVVNDYRSPLVLPSKTDLGSGLLEYDARDAGILRLAFHRTKPDWVVNAAGLVNSGKCYDHEVAAYEANTVTAQTVATVLHTYHPEAKLLHMGTTASYVSTYPIHEGTSPGFFQTAYSFTKLLGEKLVEEVMPAIKLLTILPVFVYGGATDTSSVISTLIRRGLTKDRSPIDVNLHLGKSKAPLHVKDFVFAVAELMRFDAIGRFVVGNDKDSWPYSSIVEAIQYLHPRASEGVNWMEDIDSLGRHVPDSRKMRQRLAPGLEGWPRVGLMEGLRLQTELLKSSS